jgi:hypothetical protein
MPRPRRQPPRLTGFTPGIAGRSATTEAGERALLRSVERGEWTTIANVGSAKARYASYAQTTGSRHRRP